jgi:hypothetical protein
MRLVLRIALGLLLTTVARADSFTYTFLGQNFNLYGTMSGELVSPGIYQVTGMTGAIIPGQDPPLNEIYALLSPGEFNHADNLLFANEPYVDPFGINFMMGSGVIYALTHDQIGYVILGCVNGGCTDISQNRGVLEVASTVPEPSSLLLLASGLGLLGTQIRRTGFRRV